MNISIILAHPDQNSFNHAVARTACSELTKNGHTISFHDLYEEGFDPILVTDEIPGRAELPEIIEKHCTEISNADGIIIIHPNWWGMPPAILKGWVDRVIRSEVAYKFLEGDKGEGVPLGLLKAKAAIVFNTANTSAERENKVFGDPLETIWKNCIFGLCGVEKFYRETFTIIVTSTIEERQNWLENVKKVVDAYFPSDNTFE